MQNIKNYYQVNEYLGTSGQPLGDDFVKIAGAGYQVVINLAMPTSENALANEGALVTASGMAYFHIPVIWEAPKVEDVDLFFKVMQALSRQKVWVHCALNMRVSCFVYLYQKHVLGLPDEQARYPMSKIWQPTGVWQDLIDKVNQRRLVA